MPVPTLDSHATSNTAGSAYAAVTAGGWRRTSLWSPGTGPLMEKESSTRVMEGRPQITTNTLSRMNGDQATRICLVVNPEALRSTGNGGAPGKFHDTEGRQILPKKNARSRSVPMPPRMSTSEASMKFDQKNWMPPNVNPQTSSPGQTAKVSRVVAIIRTIQKGRNSVVRGRMRPTMALKSGSGNPVTAVRVRMGLPSPP